MKSAPDCCCSACSGLTHHQTFCLLLRCGWRLCMLEGTSGEVEKILKFWKQMSDGELSGLLLSINVVLTSTPSFQTWCFYSTTLLTVLLLGFIFDLNTGQFTYRTKVSSYISLCFQHQVAKEYHDRGPRINLTFRTIHPEPEGHSPGTKTRFAAKQQ